MGNVNRRKFLQSASVAGAVGVGVGAAAFQTVQAELAADTRALLSDEELA